MPFKSQAQRRKFAQLLVQGTISNDTFEEWNRETGRKALPEAAQRQREGVKESDVAAPTTSQKKRWYHQPPRRYRGAVTSSMVRRTGPHAQDSGNWHSNRKGSPSGRPPKIHVLSQQFAGLPAACDLNGRCDGWEVIRDGVVHERFHELAEKRHMVPLYKSLPTTIESTRNRIVMELGS